MPQYRQQRVHRGIDGMERRDAGVAFCCLPTGCERVYEEPIILEDPGDAVKVFCNNEVCHMGTWMHGDCFATWEQHVLAYLRSCGRARSWSEKQRLQNLWTKKGYDLAYKACDCKCGKGHLRKDLDYLPPPRSDERKPRRVKHKSGGGMAAKPMPLALKTPTGGAGLIPAVCVPGMNPHRDIRPQLRVRTSSFGSTGSSPPSSAGTPPLTPGGATTPGKKNNKTFEFFADATQAAAGNIFKRRMDFSAFSCLPRHQQNPYHIKMEDEGPYGNDETRCFVLANLSTNLVTSVHCVACQIEMHVFDRYPLIDGTFFLSPQRYNTDLQVISDHRPMYLNAVCMRCMEGSRDIRCQACRKAWHGRTLLIGTMYAWDIFAAVPCCAFRLSCKNCRQGILDPETGFNFYSEYSRPIECPHCHSRDYHFVKPLEQTFYIKQPICT